MRALKYLRVQARYARKYTRARCAQIPPQRRAPRATCAARAARRIPAVRRFTTVCSDFLVLSVYFSSFSAKNRRLRHPPDTLSIWIAKSGGPAPKAARLHRNIQVARVARSKIPARNARKMLARVARNIRRAQCAQIVARDARTQIIARTSALCAQTRARNARNRENVQNSVK